MSETTTENKKRCCYSVAFKLQVVDFVTNGHSKSRAAIEYGIHRRNVQAWCQTEQKLRDIKSKGAKRLAGGGRKVRYGNIDEAVWTWFQDRRAEGVRVTQKMLKYEVLRMHKDNGSQSFKASAGWVRRFKRQHNISFRTGTHISYQPKEISDERVDRFLNLVLRMRRLHNYPDRCLGNMDETPAWLDMPGLAGACTLDEIGKFVVIILRSN